MIATLEDWVVACWLGTSGLIDIAIDLIYKATLSVALQHTEKVGLAIFTDSPRMRQSHSPE